MRLESGIYKVISTGPFTKAHYLRVFIQNNRKYYQLNDGHPHATGDDEQIYLDGYRLIKKLQRPLDVVKGVRITMEWHDSDGDTYETTVNDFGMLRRFFETYPEVAKAGGAKKIKG